jgi:DNA-binding LacI/PurR family transcriptional regulator
VIPIATYYRFRTDEKAMADLAVDRLYALGHRSLAVSGCSRFGETIWIPQRIARLKDAARRFDPPLTVLEAPQNEPWWVRLDPNVWSDTSMIDYIEAVRKNLALQAGMQGTHTLRKALMECVPSLASVVKGPCTAILPLNDWIAANDYHWFRGVGVSIPSELSLLSFDNERRWEFLPFSSIDFGLTDLGYLAAHVFVGDIPIACDRQGNVAGKPRLVDRGSLGPAHRK